MKHRASGFTLIEVLVAIVVVTIGLLGLARVQALALANTQVSSVRSLLAFQAGNLAASMHGNRAFWAANVAKLSFTTSDGATTDTTSSLGTAPSTGCDGGVCTSKELAAYDVAEWAAALKGRFPTATSAVDCSAFSTTTPVACTVQLSWTEKTLTSNSATSAIAPQSQSLILQVVP